MLSRIRANEFLCIWSIWNGLFLALLSIITVLGWSTRVIQGDRSYFSHLIVAVFLIAWGFAFHRALWVARMSKRINQLSRRYSDMIARSRSPEDAREAFQTSLIRKGAVLEYTPRLLVNLSLVGTVVGIMLGMSEVNADMLGNLETAGRALSVMLRGLAIGFTATLIGSAGAVWIQFQEHLIGQEIARVYERVLEQRQTSERQR